MRAGSSLSARISGRPWARYLLAAGAVLSALLIAAAVPDSPATALPYILLFPGVAFSALYCGIGPSLLAVLLALIGLRYQFVPPVHSFLLPDRTHGLGLLVFVFASGLVLAIGEMQRRNNAALWNAQDDLEIRVQDRTAQLDSATRSLRELSARLLRSQDEERRRLARELHDSVGQTMAALSMNLASVRNDIERLTKTSTTLSDSDTLLQQMSNEVRTMSHLLHPPLLDEAGLECALRWYVDGFAERSKIKVDLDLPQEFGRLPQELETAIFRVVQESLTNIHRHSGSDVAMIHIRKQDGEALVEIEDKGKGMPAEKREEISSAGAVGVGIRGMRERLRQLGGTLKIDSSSAGTLVVARLPVAPPPERSDGSASSGPSSTAAA